MRSRKCAIMTNLGIHVDLQCNITRSWVEVTSPMSMASRAARKSRAEGLPNSIK